MNKLLYSIPLFLVFSLLVNLGHAQKYRLGTNPTVGHEPVMDVPQESVATEPAPKEVKRDRKELVDEVANEFYDKGLRAYKEGRLDQAEGFFDRVLILKPDHIEAQKGIELIMKTYERPAKKVEVADKEDPKMTLLKRLEDDLKDQFTKGNWSDAIVTAEQILAIFPKNELASNKIKEINRKSYLKHISTARDHEEAQRYDKAILAYKMAGEFKKDPSLRYKIKSLNEKIALQKKERSEASYLLALTASQNGETDKAIQLCKKALVLDAENIQAKRMLERLSLATRN